MADHFSPDHHSEIRVHSSYLCNCLGKIETIDAFLVSNAGKDKTQKIYWTIMRCVKLNNYIRASAHRTRDIKYKRPNCECEMVSGPGRDPVCNSRVKCCPFTRDTWPMLDGVFNLLLLLTAFCRWALAFASSSSVFLVVGGQSGACERILQEDNDMHNIDQRPRSRSMDSAGIEMHKIIGPQLPSGHN